MSNRQEFFEDFKEGFNLSNYLDSLSGNRGKIQSEMVDVVVCICDLNGFSDFLESARSHNKEMVKFINQYEKIYINAVLKAQWLTKHSNGKDLRWISPDLFTFTGMKAMIAWEYPSNLIASADSDIEYFITCSILNIFTLIQSNFRKLIGRFVSAGIQSLNFDDLRIGIGVDRSQCYRKTTKDGKILNYIGNAVNMATYLQLQASGQGVIASIEFVERDISAFSKRTQIGDIHEMEDRLGIEAHLGINGPLQIWQGLKSYAVPLLVEQKNKSLYGLDYAEFLPFVPDRLLKREDGQVTFELPPKEESLSPEEINDYINFRQAVEVLTVKKLAFVKAKNAKFDLTQISNVFDAMTDALSRKDAGEFVRQGDFFHRAIASLATNSDEQAKDLVHKLWLYTAHQTEGTDGIRVTPEYILNRYAQDVISEHKAIFNAILEGNVSASEDAIIEHMNKQRVRSNFKFS